MIQGKGRPDALANPQRIATASNCRSPADSRSGDTGLPSSLKSVNSYDSGSMLSLETRPFFRSNNPKLSRIASSRRAVCRCATILRNRSSVLRDFSACFSTRWFVSSAICRAATRSRCRWRSRRFASSSASSFSSSPSMTSRRSSALFLSVRTAPVFH